MEMNRRKEIQDQVLTAVTLADGLISIRKGLRPGDFQPRQSLEIRTSLPGRIQSPHQAPPQAKASR